MKNKHRSAREFARMINKLEKDCFISLVVENFNYNFAVNWYQRISYKYDLEGTEYSRFITELWSWQICRKKSH